LIEFSLIFPGLSGGYDAVGVAPHGEDKRDDRPAEGADRDVSFFDIAAGSDPKVLAKQDCDCVNEVDPVLVECGEPLGFVPFEHVLFL
jgi:hypothetical protein